jgi:hypothetical protein
MMASGSTIKRVDSEYMYTKTERVTKEDGLMINKKEKELKYGRTVQFLWGISEWGKKTAEENFNGVMAPNTRGS